VKWYENVWAWVKKYWGVVVGAVAFVVGIILGRKSVSGTIADYERLRHDFAELQREFDELGREAHRLGELNTSANNHIRILGEELDRARADITGAQEQIELGRANVDQLDEAIGRLRGFAERYRTELESL